MKGKYTSYENIIGAWGHILALYVQFYCEKGEFFMSCLITSKFKKLVWYEFKMVQVLENNTYCKD